MGASAPLGFTGHLTKLSRVVLLHVGDEGAHTEWGHLPTHAARTCQRDAIGMAPLHAVPTALQPLTRPPRACAEPAGQSAGRLQAPTVEVQGNSDLLGSLLTKEQGKNSSPWGWENSMATPGLHPALQGAARLSPPECPGVGGMCPLITVALISNFCCLWSPRQIVYLAFPFTSSFS